MFPRRGADRLTGRGTDRRTVSDAGQGDADDYLRQTTLDYTILGPGRLTAEPATERIRLVTGPDDGDGDGRERIADDRKITSRENVAAVITHVVSQNTAVRQTVNFYDGPTPIADAIG